MEKSVPVWLRVELNLVGSVDEKEPDEVVGPALLVLLVGDDL